MTLDKGAKVQFLSGNPRMEKWLFGTILTRLSDLHYEVEYKGKRVKHHIDQMKNTFVPDEGDDTNSTTPEAQTSIDNPVVRRFSSFQMSPQGRSEVSGSDLNYFTPTQSSHSTTTEGSDTRTDDELPNQSSMGMFSLTNHNWNRQLHMRPQDPLQCGLIFQYAGLQGYEKNALFIHPKC